MGLNQDPAIGMSTLQILEMGSIGGILVPTAKMIPGPKANVKFVTVKKLVVGSWGPVGGIPFPG